MDLLGTHAPKPMEAWEVLESCGNRPYAVRTVLGWSMNGHFGAMHEAGFPSVSGKRNAVTTKDSTDPTDQLILYFSDWRRLNRYLVAQGKKDPQELEPKEKRL